jgi:putative membrane protein
MINFLIAAIAGLHIYFLILEMFLWTKPRGLKTFKQSLDQALASRALAANQGLYNGFLAAGLIWSLVAPSPDFTRSLQIFFLLCVVVAGAFGGLTVNRKIFFIQGVPAVVALGLVICG